MVHWPILPQLVGLPLQVIDLVGILALLPLLLVGFVLQNLHPFPSTRLIFAGLSYRVQLANLILQKEGGWGWGEREGERERKH